MLHRGLAVGGDRRLLDEPDLLEMLPVVITGHFGGAIQASLYLLALVDLLSLCIGRLADLRQE